MYVYPALKNAYTQYCRITNPAGHGLPGNGLPGNGLPANGRISILFICIVALSFASCGMRKQPAPPPLHNAQIIEQLSRQFGLRLTPTDNISLYKAGSGWLGVKYRYGGNTKNGVDCSGLVCNLYKQVYEIKLERTTANILKKNCIAVSRNKLHEGDLVFFKTLGSAQSRVPTHVGIYLKNGKFIHASTSKGVMVSSLSEAYYVRTWITGGKVKR